MSEKTFALRQELKDETKKLARLERIEELEHAVFEQAAQVVCAVLQFHEVTPQQSEPPPDWVAQYGRAVALQKLAVAKSGWLPPSLSPAAINHAIKIVAASSRGRKFNQLKLQANTVNVKLELPAPTSREHPGPVQYEVRDLET